jgi:HAE1 family hydrophobic/amphiphilic exporter-1
MTRFFVRHPVSTWMIFIAFVVLAIYALPKIEVEAIPEVDLPTISVTTRWNGASPKAIQRSITLQVEEAVRGTHGIEKVTSESRAGTSVVTAEFRRDIELDFARMEINERLGDVRRNLPLGANQPAIQSFVPEEFQTDQFFSFSVESALEPNELRERAERWIVPQVLGLEGVADAQVLGGANPLVKISLDRRKLEFYGIAADEVFNVLLTLDDLLSAGAIEQDGLEKLVSLRENVTLETLRDTVVARRGDVNFTIGMLGSVDPDFEDPRNFVRNNGKTVVQVQVEKRSGGNAVEVSRTLRAALPEIEKDLPFDARLIVDADEGEELEEELRELLLRSAAILTVLFILLAITLRQVILTAIVIASILFALVICLSLFYFLQISVNFITISGLTICFGLLLDNSILVLDAIHRRLESLERAEDAGLSRRAKMRVVVETVVQGTGDVTFPIMATTLTTVVAFLSFIFLSGRLAVYYVPLAISVGLAMIASVFVAFGWIPVVLKQSWAGRLVNRTPDGPNEIESDDQLDEIVHVLPDLEARESLSRRLGSLAQHFWPLTVSLLAVLLFFTWKTYDEDVIKGGFFRFGNDETLVCYMRMPAGTDVQVTSETFFKFEEALLPLEEGVEMRANVFGNQAYMEIEFTDELLKTPTPMLYRALLTEQADLIGASSIFIRGFADQPYIKGNFGGSAGNSMIKVTGYNSKILAGICDDNLRKVQRNRRVRNAIVTTSDRRFGRASTDETVIELRRDVLANYGLSVTQVVGQVRRLLGVDIPWRMIIAGEQERVQLAYDDADDIEFSDAANFVINTPSGEKVHLGELITLETVPLSDSISREDQRYSMYINWEYVGTDKMRRAFLKSILDTIDLPYGYHAEEEERTFLTEEEDKTLVLTLVLALSFIFIVLAALFESFSWRILVFISLPVVAVVLIARFGPITWEGMWAALTGAFDYAMSLPMVIRSILFAAVSVALAMGLSVFVGRVSPVKMLFTIVLLVLGVWLANQVQVGWEWVWVLLTAIGALLLAFPAPILILVSLAMALVGVVYLFAWSDATFDSSARIGLVLLFGIVVNNAILLVSRYRHEAALTLKAVLGGEPELEAGILPGAKKKLGGSDLYQLDPKKRRGLLRRAIARGTMVKLRSILLTSGTTIVGLLPLIIQFEREPWTLLGVELPFTLSWLDSTDQAIWDNLALASIGGMISSTILLLIGMPALYYGSIVTGWAVRDVLGWIGRKLTRQRRSDPVAGPVEA